MNSDPKTRYSLIGKLRNSRDAEAWNEFTSIYQPLIFRICLSKGLQHADATDVTQEVLARVAEAIEKFDHQHENATFRGWLFRVTRNMVMDFFRNQKRDLLVQVDTPLKLMADPTIEESVEFQIEYQRQIFWVVAQEVQAQVKPATWQAFWMTEIEQKPVKDVATELDMKSGAIYMARSRVFSRLKKAIEKRLDATRELFV